MGKLKAGRCRLASAMRTYGRAANGGTWRGGVRSDDGSSGVWRLGTTAGGPAGSRCARNWAKNEKGYRRNPFEFLNKVLGSKIKGFKYF
jgi:hypothetical protein